MNGQLQKVAEMIKKTFHTKAQNDCFDGCTLFIEEHCTAVRSECTKSLEEKFGKIDDKLETIMRDVRDIKNEVGLNGTSEGKS